MGGTDEQDFKIKTGYLVKALLNVPLKVNGRVVGVLGVDKQISSAPFTQAHLNQMSMLADIAAIALENARQYAQNPDLKAAMQEAGVTGPPNITFLTSD